MCRYVDFFPTFLTKKNNIYIYLYIAVYRLYIDISTFSISFPLLAWLKGMTNSFFYQHCLDIFDIGKKYVYLP